MYIVEFHNTRPNDQVDAHGAIEAHRAFLAHWVEQGVILAAVPKVPRTGGFMVIADVSRADLDAMLADDPFLRAGSARCDITEFRGNFVAPGLRASGRS